MPSFFKVRSVLLSHDSSAVTLSPVEWTRESDTQWEMDEEGKRFRPLEDCAPDAEGAEPDEIGGKMTELRLSGQTEFRPGDFVTVTVKETKHNWTP